MGSTVSTAKQVAAFQTRSGKTAYVLFEQMYEKNCYPHTPDWSCVSMGYAEDVIRDIFRRGCSCEGGMLQTRSGYITPEGYLKGWFDRLAAPLQMPDVKQRLSFGTSWSSVLPADHEGRIQQLLLDAGFADKFAAIKADGLDVSLHDDFDLLHVIYCKTPLSVWQLIGRSIVPSEHWALRGDLGYQPKKLKAEPADLPRLYRFGDETILSQNANGTFSPAGWAYSVVAQFIANYADLEIQYPGSYRKAIKEKRDMCTSAPQVPMDARVHLSKVGLTDPWPVSKYNDIASMVGQTGDTFSMVLADIKAMETEKSHLLYHLGNISESQWHIETPPVTVASITAAQATGLLL